MTGVLSTVDLDDATLVRKAQSSPDIIGRDLVREVMPDGSLEWKEGLSTLGTGFRPSSKAGSYAGARSAMTAHRT